MLGQLRRAVELAANDPAVVGIVITGTGRGFCSGLDVSAFNALPTGPVEPPITEEVPGLFTYLLEVPKPVIAAVNGAAAGGGLILATMCDIRFVSRAAMFMTVFLHRGLVAEHGTTWMLPRLVGAARSLDLFLTNERIDAERAYEIGLAQYVTKPEDLVPAATDYVRRFAASAPPAAIADTKRMIYRHLGMGYPEALHEAMAVQATALGRPEAAEANRALLEKRPPRFERIP
jgi:enoyl-CoA hydratase/carnithine racemase